MTIAIGPALQPAHLISELRTRRRDSVLGEMARCAHSLGVVRDPAPLLGILLLREKLGPTAVGRGVAIPNARTLLVRTRHLFIGRSPRGIEWGGADGTPVRLVLLTLSPPETPAVIHQDLVARTLAALRPARIR